MHVYIEALRSWGNLGTYQPSSLFPST